MKTLYRQFQLNVQSHKLFSGRQKLLLAISGGVDSTVLADLLFKYESNPRSHLFLAHIDHQLRADSANETKLIDDQFANRGLCVFHEKWPLEKHPHSGIEDAARKFRYDFYKRMALKVGARKIILAQHADDQAETTLLKIIRGADWQTVSAMEWSRPLEKDSPIEVVRPLLNVEKSEIYDYAEKNHLKWIEDSTNKDPDYTSRNQIRNVVLPALKQINPNSARNIASFAEQIREVNENQLIEMLKIWLHDSIGFLPIKRSQLEQFERLLKNEKEPHGKIDLTDGFSLVKNKDEIKIKKER
ncbi:tRNA(Ile)-lysidine synthase [Oenococcus oeni]|uniref:tRNA lysidine(34) synthetase TilS n=1 Tax=Oenococcus oeni TaxID=1247 RepID=UPI0010B1FA9D|nr:tRNA lysidine(34) synthetase TilS [Oenococcus oeni]SYW01195.1 tRNA(Ile)-lysidine synthase [Oenococcus oeni]SYW12792.1 tRNA(Ile)-lysidine synthase [Oenococcus oeni]